MDNKTTVNHTQSERDIQQLEEQYIDAMRKANLAFFDRIFSDNYVFIGSDGSTWGKEKVLQDFRNPKYDLQEIEIYNRHIFIHENAAVVTGISVIEGRIGTNSVTGKYQFMRVWNRSRGSWKVIAVYTSNMKQ